MPFPDQLLQEIRVLLGVYCQDCVLTDAPDGAATDKQMVLIAKSFHGSEAYASHAKLFMQGSGVFSTAFKKKHWRIIEKEMKHGPALMEQARC